MEDLEQLLGVKYHNIVQNQERLILPLEAYYGTNERRDESGSTRLMQAAGCGAWQQVDFLLKCGAEVNMCDKERKKAIDYALDGGHPEVVLLLLKRNSQMPWLLTEERHSTRFEAMIDQHEGLKKFILNRDNFHKILMEQETERIEPMLKTFLDESDPPRYFVGSDGESALFKALKNEKYDTWALLRASGFAYATDEERRHARTIEHETPFIDAIGNHFVELSGCHVQKMLAKSKVYGCLGVDVDACTIKVEKYLQDIDEDEYTSALLQCLQDDPSLEIIFDFSSEDIQHVHPMEGNSKVWGLTEFVVNRIYAAAKESENFTFSDVVSNLVHELAHKTFALVFENCGLPYRKEDSKAEKSYSDVVSTVLSDERKQKCDVIIQRAAGYNRAHELIVRVPEMISKYKKRSDGESIIKSGISHLQKDAPELLKFYNEWVQCNLIEYIRKSRTAGKFHRRDWLKTTLLTDYCDEKVQVDAALKEVLPLHHNRISLLKVSDLKLGVSHLKLSLKDVTFVDWTRYQKDLNIFKIAVRRNEIRKLAIIWDKEDAPWFCKSGICTNRNCIGAQLDEEVLRCAILIMPMKFPVLPELKGIDYSWNDLSSETKSWVLGKELYFGGTKMILKNILESVVGVDVETFTFQGKTIESLLSIDALSELFDKKTIHIGRPLRLNLKVREVELLHQHPECFIQRSIKVRGLEFNKGLFISRVNDAFFISNARKSDLEGMDIRDVFVWTAKEIQEGIRCFILSRDSNHVGNSDLFRGISRTFRDCNQSKGGKWHFIHFFDFEKGEYFHYGSINCRRAVDSISVDKGTFKYPGMSLFECCSEPNEVLIVADAPGSGKSVFVNKMALEVKKKHKKCWVDVIELPLFEDNFSKWKDIHLTSKELAKDFLYTLVKTESSHIERIVYDLFFETEKFFIFFDGFDEICPNYREIFTSFLELLEKNTCIKLCLTTRVHESTDLEERLSTFTYKFVPFDIDEQRRFLNLEWNSSLRYLPPDEKVVKVRNIMAALHLSHGPEKLKGITKVIEDLEGISEEDQNAKSCNVNFDEVAKELIEMGKSTVDGKVDFSENPLHAWLLAYVVFEENFALGSSLSLHQLYEKFIKIKIDIYSRGKVRDKECVVGDTKERGFRSSMYRMLKEYSAYYFLEDEDYELDEEDVHDMLRVGLITRKRDSNVFVHRTFGEYIFSLWLLEKCMKKKVTKAWLSRVLLEKKFDKVRQFINDMLLSDHEEKNLPDESAKQKKCVLNQPGVDELSKVSKRVKLVESIQKCFYMSILECHGGITEFLTVSYSTLLVDVMFGKADWDIRSLESPTVLEDGEWNALTICGRCIRGEDGMQCAEQVHRKIYSPDKITRSRIEYEVHRRSELDYLKFLPVLLRLVEKYGLIMNLEQVISNKGLSWMGFDQEKLWRGEIGRAQFEFIFSFLARNSNAMTETLRAKLFIRDSRALFRYGAVYLFDILVYFLEFILDKASLVKFILEKENMLDAWISVFQVCGVEEVEHMWKYLVHRLEGPKDRKRILRRTDERQRNAIFSACANWEHQEVLPYVWYLCLNEMDHEEFRTYLFESFSRTVDSVMLKTDRLLGCLSDIVADGHLTKSEAVSLLLMTDIMEECYLLRFYSKYSPNLLYKFQQFLATEDLGPKEILSNMKGHYIWLAPSCLEYSDWYGMDEGFISQVEHEFQQILPAIEEFPFVSQIQVDNEGYLLGVLDEYGGRVKGIFLKVFLVLVRDQIKLEKSLLGSDLLVRRFKEECIWIYDYSPPLRIKGESGESKCFLIPYFFAILLSECLSKEEVTDILLQNQGLWGTIFNYMLYRGDINAYHRCREIVKWTIGEENLGSLAEAKRDIDGNSSPTLPESTKGIP